MSIRLDLTDPTAVLLAVQRALRNASIRAATYGGLALAAYGEPRETKDADLAVAITDAPGVLAALRSSGLDASLTFEKVRFGGNLVTRFTLLAGDDQTGLNTVDLVEPRSARFAAGVLDRAMEGTLRSEAILVVTPEDFVLMKVLSTRDRDVEDASSVVQALGPRIDLAAVRAEARRLAAEIPDHDIAGRLARAAVP